MDYNSAPASPLLDKSELLFREEINWSEEWDQASILANTLYLEQRMQMLTIHETDEEEEEPHIVRQGSSDSASTSSSGEEQKEKKRLRRKCPSTTTTTTPHNTFDKDELEGKFYLPKRKKRRCEIEEEAAATPRTTKRGTAEKLKDEYERLYCLYRDHVRRHGGMQSVTYKTTPPPDVPPAPAIQDMQERNNRRRQGLYAYFKATCKWFRAELNTDG
jgi:hypothetical protein